MTTDFPTAPSAYGLYGPSAAVTVEKSTHASHTEILTPPKTMAQASLFSEPEDDRGLQLMVTLDIINRRWGRGTLRSAAEGMEKPWQMKRQRAE